MVISTLLLLFSKTRLLLTEEWLVAQPEQPALLLQTLRALLILLYGLGMLK